MRRAPLSRWYTVVITGSPSTMRFSTTAEPLPVVEYWTFICPESLRTPDHWYGPSQFPWRDLIRPNQAEFPTFPAFPSEGAPRSGDETIATQSAAAALRALDMAHLDPTYVKGNAELRDVRERAIPSLVSR